MASVEPFIHLYGYALRVVPQLLSSFVYSNLRTFIGSVRLAR